MLAKTPRRGDDSRRRKAVFKGIKVVPGVALGPVRLKLRRTQVLSDRTISEADVPREIERLAEAVRLSKEQLLEARAKLAREVGELEAMIFDAHIAILEDQKTLRKIREIVSNDLKPIEVVVAETVEGYYRSLKALKDEHLRERSADLRDVGRRLLDNLVKPAPSPRTWPTRSRPAARRTSSSPASCCPPTWSRWRRRHCQAVITELGSDRGHAAVMLRAMNVPSIMGLTDLAENIEDGDFVIVDGSSGTVYVNPKKDIVDAYQNTRKEFEEVQQAAQEQEVDLPAVTTDGFAISMLANVLQAFRHRPGQALQRRRGSELLFAAEFHPDDRLELP